MLTETEQQIRIDLDQFKLHLNIEPKIHLSVHFDTPSRKFYLSVIALVVNEMKSNRGVRSILLKTHQEVLALLNETVGEFAGSSTKGKLIPRIYKKWKSALPDMENAPLFRIVGRKKEYGSGIDKTYICSENEKDSWANLFEYKGSGENVRLRFSIDAIGAKPDSCSLIYKDYAAGKAWGQFISDLKKDRIEPASIDRMAYPLPEKPSIAVLPFNNLSDDPEQEYFSDGLTEEIITALSKFTNLFVIARNSTFTYKEKPVKVQQVSEDLGVRYVLEGSVRKSNNQMRISAQLIDAITGHHLWADRYNRNIEDIFAIQDEITIRIITELQLELTESDALRDADEGTKNLDAYLKVMRSNEYFILFTPDNNIRSRQLAQAAIDLDPEYTTAWAMLAYTHLMAVYIGWSQSPQNSLEKAVKITQKIDNMGDKNNTPVMWAFIYWLDRNYEKAIREMQKALSLNPNNDFYNAFLGDILVYAGRPQDAIALVQKAMRLNPFYPTYYLCNIGRAYAYTERYDEAIEAYESALKRGDRNDNAHLGLAINYMRVGHEEQAKTHAQEFLKIHPQFCLSQLQENSYFKDPAITDRIVEILRRAGLN